MTNLQDVYSNFGEHVDVEAPVGVLGHLEHELGPGEEDCGGGY
jgi:hypothetical protein